MDHKLMEKLVEKAKNGDSEAAMELLLEFSPFIQNSARKIYIQNHDFEDMVQIGRLSFLKALEMYDNSGGFSFPAYAVNAVKNNYRNEIRKAASTEYVCDTEKLCQIPSDENMENNFIKKETANILRECLRHIPKEDMDLIDWYYFKGLSIKEYAAVHGLPYNLVVKKKQRILKRLKKLMLSYSP